MRIEDLDDSGFAAALRLNNAAVPNVNELDETSFAELLKDSQLALAAEIDGELAGFVVVVGPGTEYDSENYRWFSARYTDFWYLDRIVVDPSHRGAGIGAELHAAVLERARTQDDVTSIALEVNLEPPNPGSIRFHERLGFTEVDTYRGSSGKLVSLRTKTVR